jgi:WXG100 family type VII secretion target
MAKNASSGNVKHLDTANFNATMTAYATYIKQFEAIVRDVNNTCETMVDRWKGNGRNAFEKDYKQVQLNLKDLSEIMYDLRDALVDAHAEYMKTDSALSKSFDS